MQQSGEISLIASRYLLRLPGTEAQMRIRNVFRKIIWLAQCTAFAFAAFSTEAADSGIVTFQGGSDVSSENAKVLIGHWRKTTIGYVGPSDENLVLHADGTAEKWVVTAYNRTEPMTGRWSVEGKTLTLSFGDNENSRPFTMYQGQLVFPNIPNRRQFWDKIE
jgi:hypothetical protein